MESLGRVIAVAVALLAAFSAAVWVAAFVWACQDVRRRTNDIYVQLFASFLVLLLGPFGAVLYLILRPAETLNETYLQRLQEETMLQEVVEPRGTLSIHSVNGIKPHIGRNVYIAPGVQLIGDVRIADDVSIWHNTVIRADLAPIMIGRGTNIQDGCVLHVDADRPLVIGADVTVGHMAVLHACTIADECLIGIQSTVLSGAIIRRHSIVGAAALVGEAKEFEERNVLLGVPARVVRTTTESEILELIVERAREYRVSAARALHAAHTSST